MEIYGQSDKKLLETLGERLKGYRLRQNLTQDQLADRAGLSTSTIKGLEAGRGRLDSLVAVLRALHRLDALESFLPDPGISPLQLAARHGKPRMRASGSAKTPASKIIKGRASTSAKIVKSKAFKRPKPKW